jgi:heat shock protein HslJ
MWLADKSDISDTRRSEIYIHLTAEGGTVQGFAGCNRLRGRYELDETTLRLSNLPLTRKACIEGIMERERELLNALENSEMWNIQGNQLELLNRNEEVLARFQARD